ncbi:MAG: hypothetical protein WBF17_06415 [Phycisphaerae bacterium]
MWRRMSALAASALVLLPVGGTSYVAHANGTPAVADVALGSAPSWIPQPMAFALLLLNVAWLILRCRQPADAV